MKPIIYHNFSEAIQQASYFLQYRSKLVHSARWQGSDIANRPEMATHEVTHCSFSVDLSNTAGNLEAYREAIKPNLPWADNHFEERVCGAPINPGVEWANWPYGKSAATFLDELGKFNHNYMERYWPKYAQLPKAGPPTATAAEWDDLMIAQDPDDLLIPHHGIRYQYGDLDDVVQLLASDPYTRQAYLPIWFPEDTGGGEKRAPCTIGYHFLMREGKLDINYHIRSCDFVRHFRDDLYLTVRLLLWVLDRCAERDDRWKEVQPGRFNMQIGSLHVFRNDYTMLFGAK